MYIISLPEGITAMDSKITVRLLEGNFTDSISSRQQIRFSVVKQRLATK